MKTFKFIPNVHTYLANFIIIIWLKMFDWRNECLVCVRVCMFMPPYLWPIQARHIFQCSAHNVRLNFYWFDRGLVFLPIVFLQNICAQCFHYVLSSYVNLFLLFPRTETHLPRERLNYPGYLWSEPLNETRKGKRTKRKKGIENL